MARVCNGARELARKARERKRASKAQKALRPPFSVTYCWAYIGAAFSTVASVASSPRHLSYSSHSHAPDSRTSFPLEGLSRRRFLGGSVPLICLVCLVRLGCVLGLVCCPVCFPCLCSSLCGRTS